MFPIIDKMVTLISRLLSYTQYMTHLITPLNIHTPIFDHGSKGNLHYIFILNPPACEVKIKSQSAVPN